MNPFDPSKFKRNIFLQSKRKDSNEWEETLFDGNDPKEPQTTKPLFNHQKLVWLYFFIFFLLAIIISRTYYLQIVQGELYRKSAEENRFRINITSPSRGIIYDSSKTKLVQNIPSFDIYLIPADLPKSLSEKKQIIDNLKNLINIDDSAIEHIMIETHSSSYEPIELAKQIERETALILEARLYEFPGIKIQKTPKRKYLNSENFSHLIGYTGKITKEEYDKYSSEDKLYLYTDYTGKNGLELYYEDILRGEYGREQVEVDSSGKPKRIIASEDPISGNDIILSIDSKVQDKVFEILNKHLAKINRHKGSIVMQEVNTGNILAMSTLPTYDLNKFADGITQNDYDALLNDENKPLINRSVNGTYPPGSTIKPVVATAALDENIVSPSTIIVDKGSIDVPNKYNPDIVYHFVGWDLSGLGNMNAISAIAKSSDIYFYVISGGYEDKQGLGVEKLTEYYQKFGLGDRLGIDLPSESTGLIPSPEWKLKAKGEEWYLGDTYHMGIGQGDVLTTPLQVSSFTSTVANGGTVYTPRIVKKIIDNKTKSIKELHPHIIRENVTTEHTNNIVKAGMRETILSGTAKSFQYASYTSAGKTGTAQFANNEKTHAWYTCYAPYENPEISLTVLVEGGGGGNEVAVPVAKEILDWYFDEYKNNSNE